MLSSCKDFSVFLNYLEKYKQETDRFVQTLHSSSENMSLLSRNFKTSFNLIKTNLTFN